MDPTSLLLFLTEWLRIHPCWFTPKSSKRTFMGGESILNDPLDGASSFR
jgi:hypothetical protein